MPFFHQPETFLGESIRILASVQHIVPYMEMRLVSHVGNQLPGGVMQRDAYGIAWDEPIFYGIRQYPCIFAVVRIKQNSDLFFHLLVAWYCIAVEPVVV